MKKINTHACNMVELKLYGTIKTKNRQLFISRDINNACCSYIFFGGGGRRSVEENKNLIRKTPYRGDKNC